MSLNFSRIKYSVPFLLLFSGCALNPSYLAPNFHTPERIAVLPFANETNDVEGPEIVRKALLDILPSRGYGVVPPEEVDTVLREKFGVTDGGQLVSVAPQRIARALGADGLIFGNLLAFQDLPLGYARKRTVKANLRLLDGGTGELLWEEQKSWTTPELFLNTKDVRNAAAAQVADRQFRRMTGTFLKEETHFVLGLALQTLPARVFGPELPKKR